MFSKLHGIQEGGHFGVYTLVNCSSCRRKSAETCCTVIKPATITRRSAGRIQDSWKLVCKWHTGPEGDEPHGEMINNLRCVLTITVSRGGWKKLWSLDGLVQEVVEELAWASEWRREENNCERWLPPRRKSRSIVMFCFASSWREVDPAAKPRGWCGKYLWTNWRRWNVPQDGGWPIQQQLADRNINVIIMYE